MINFLASTKIMFFAQKNEGQKQIMKKNAYICSINIMCHSFDSTKT